MVLELWGWRKKEELSMYDPSERGQETKGKGREERTKRNLLGQAWEHKAHFVRLPS